MPPRNLEMVSTEPTILSTCEDTAIPELGVIEQVWETDPIPTDEIDARARGVVDDLALDSVPTGGEIAVGVGSRGIANIAEITRGVVAELQIQGYEPFVFPAMGSHGGATAAGQRKVLATFGIEEETISCEIRATMDVEEVGRTPERNVPVYADANAVAADAIVPINRIKPHTNFAGDVESGLSKMLVIGMGKQKGAKMAHEWALDWSFRNMIPEIASLLVKRLPVAGGVAIVEDERHNTAIIEGVPSSGFLDREAELLETAYELMPELPFDDLDVVIFDQMGKDISGSGMDTNVIGRILRFNEPEPEEPFIRRIYARSLTDVSQGNASGVGQADFIHRELFEAIDVEKTVINTVTAGGARGARIPPVVETDRAGITAALSTVGVRTPEEVRLLRATDTMRLERLYASPALLERAEARDDLRVVSDPAPVEFDENGNLASPTPH